MTTKCLQLRIMSDAANKLSGHFIVVNHGLSMTKQLNHEDCTDILTRLGEPLKRAVMDASDIDLDMADFLTTD